MPDSKDPVGRLFGSRSEKMLVEHVLREVKRGRALEDVMNDAYLRNRTNEVELAALLDNQEVVEAVGAEAAADIRSRLE